MKSALIIGAAVALCGGLPASAQTSGTIAVAPATGSTGPTVPDTRRLDQTTIQPPSPSAAPTNANWRTSDGLDADPNNPSGAPSNGTLGTSPSR